MDVNNNSSQPDSQKPKTLAIALIVSAILLLAAAAIAIWVFITPNQPTDQQLVDNRQITNANFVAPKDLPAKYVEQSKNTKDKESSEYFDQASTCGITTNIAKLGGFIGKTAEEAALNFIAGEQFGVTTIKKEPSQDFVLTDTKDTSKQYTFKSYTLAQKVDLPNVKFKKQNTTVAFVQLGQQAVVISFSCKDSTWKAKKAELESLVKKFTIKTERK